MTCRQDMNLYIVYTWYKEAVASRRILYMHTTHCNNLTQSNLTACQPLQDLQYQWGTCQVKIAKQIKCDNQQQIYTYRSTVLKLEPPVALHKPASIKLNMFLSIYHSSHHCCLQQNLQWTALCAFFLTGHSIWFYRVFCQWQNGWALHKSAHFLSFFTFKL